MPPNACKYEYMMRQAANPFCQTCPFISSGKENLIADVNGEKAVFVAPQIECRPMLTEAEHKREEAEVVMRLGLKVTGDGMQKVQ